MKGFGFPIGSKVRAINDCNNTTIGRIYTVLDPTEHIKPYGYATDPTKDVCIIDDDGHVNGYLNNHFELAEDVNTQACIDVDYLSITRELCGG